MSHSPTTTAPNVPPARTIPSAEEDRVYRKVTLRLIPFLMLCYIAAYLDRVNVGFARLQMLADLGWSETVYGLGAGMFFIGYFVFEVPSNIILHRVGARMWIGRIMITWGLVSAMFMFVTTPFTFYLLRFVLGVAEAGFFPGVVLYLTYWYPSERRARIIAMFMTAIPLSGVIGAPLSGWIMQTFAGMNGWAGWQWLFVLEALPSIVLGVIVMFYLDNGIRHAKWLQEDEKQLLERKIEADRAGVVAHGSLLDVFKDPRLWRMCMIYFACAMGQYGLTFWLPALVRRAGVTDTFTNGMLTAIPYMAAVITMILLGRSSDQRRERRWHVAIPLLVGAVCLPLSAIVGTNTVLAITLLTFAAAAIISAAPLFWSLPTALLGGTAAAAGIAGINSVANLAGFVSPSVVGWLNDYTGSSLAGMYAIAAVLVVGALTVLSIPARLVNR